MKKPDFLEKSGFYAHFRSQKNKLDRAADCFRKKNIPAVLLCRCFCEIWTGIFIQDLTTSDNLSNPAGIRLLSDNDSPLTWSSSIPEECRNEAERFSAHPELRKNWRYWIKPMANRYNTESQLKTCCRKEHFSVIKQKKSQSYCIKSIVIWYNTGSPLVLYNAEECRN